VQKETKLRKEKCEKAQQHFEEVIALDKDCVICSEPPALAEVPFKNDYFFFPCPLRRD
jgi:hypothetical protein